MDKQKTILSDGVLSANILVVDDEPANLKLMERILASRGYSNVMSTQDPRQVKEMFLAQDTDLIILDLNMPYMDGYQVMEELKGLEDVHLPPILVVTAQNSSDYRQRALDNGGSDYVTKPFDAREVLSRVRNLLEVQLAQKYMRKQNELLDEKVQERTLALRLAHHRLQQTQLQVVRRLGRAAEYRDNETGLHIIRMSKIAELLGRAAGMSKETSTLLLNAAPMHDIGKIGIPDHILLKPGKFEPGEWEIMKTHAQIGADILSGDESELLTMAREIALTHHEKWDGSGYPNGLEGEDIPLVGRVTALADVFDALTSERPYKNAWPVEKAVNLIKDEQGKHFDPELVEHFLNLLQEITDIRDKYAEPEEDDKRVNV